MGLPKQAKTLTGRQTAHLQAFLQQTRYPRAESGHPAAIRQGGPAGKGDRRPHLEHAHGCEGKLGSAINLRNEATKGSSGRIIPMNRKLHKALGFLFQVRDASPFVITSERGQRTSAAVIVNFFAHWYRTLGFRGCSSHSGRRTFITTAARKISTVGGSIRDVQILAGHAALSTTQRYIEADVEAQRKVVDLL